MTSAVVVVQYVVFIVLIALRLLVALYIDIISDHLLIKHVVLGFVSVNKVFVEAGREEY